VKSTEESPKTLLEAIRAFRDPAVAQQYFAQIRWPHGVACPRMGCGSADVRYIAGKRPRWICRDCKREFTAKVGTIFEDSPIGFDKWLPAIWLLSANRNGISSCELGRALGITQKSAWFVLHRIRLAFQSQTFEQLRGEVEADETFVGPTARSASRRGKSPQGSPHANKAVVMGFRERGGLVRAFVVRDSKRDTLLPKVFEHVAPGATVYTDALQSYAELRQSYRHFVINHAERYVRDHHVHTNSIENFWSVLKRTIGGTYICPRPKHLDRYLDEQIFRFNAREDKDGPRFVEALKGADGKRLTYKGLTANP